MKRILRSRLPERLAARVPPLVVEIAVAMLISGLMVLFRIAIMPWTADRAPYAFNFVAGAAATLLAGWRSGLLAVLFGQLMIWYLVIPPMMSFQVADDARGYALVMATASRMAVVAIIALYQREVDRAWSRREEQVDLIRQALTGIDHRTTNNYQTVLALITAQANRADGPVQQALLQVADRIEAIALASKQLAMSSESLEKVRVREHLGDLCAQIHRGLSRPGVGLDCHSDDVSLDAEKAIDVSIIVNELVTNSLKHAFPDNRQGSIAVSLKRVVGGVRLEVADGGVGMTNGRRTRRGGLGSRLIDTFVKQLKADYRLSSSDEGSRHIINIPL